MYEIDFELNTNTINADLILNVIPDKTSQLINDSGYITISDVPTNLSQFVNDTGFITASDLIPLENDIVEIENDILGLQNSKVDKITGKGLSTNDFTNAFKTKLEGIEAGAEVNKVNSVNGQIGDVTINIPTKTSDLTNDTGFITGITSSDVTTALGYTPYNSTNPNGYITSSALNGYATEQYVNDIVGNIEIILASI